MRIMRHPGWLSAVALTIASFAVHAAPAPPSTPIVVELFTSEGCSDCPPADTLLEKLVAAQPVAGAEIIALGEHVDYWDRLGWKDRFSSASVTSRQQGYQTRFGTESIYTPQMVVDGRAEFVGSDANAARKAIEHAITVQHGVVTLDVVGPAVVRGGNTEGSAVHVKVSANNLPPIPKGDRADIVVLVTESGLRTEVKRGENHGRTLSHAPVVRYLATIGHVPDDGSTTGSGEAAIPLASEWQSDRLSVVAFVQQSRGRAILASASAHVKNAHP
ncbi:MAG TPA: DUF1223 domain-containing protein [Vicinamibacterales bacterium]|jgi:hypothetical protein|nr:DUF1223 domain-containing protein [Vicinamibacterales bacterium]